MGVTGEPRHALAYHVVVSFPLGITFALGACFKQGTVPRMYGCCGLDSVLVAYFWVVRPFKKVRPLFRTRS